MPRLFRLTVSALLAISLTAGAAPKKSAKAAKSARSASSKAASDDGPDILVEPVQSAVQGQGVVIDAEISDKDGVFEPKLFFRAIGETKYLSIGMVPNGRKDGYRAEIPGTSVTGPMEYFVEAYDTQGNGPARSAPMTRPHKLFVDTGDGLSKLPSLEAKAPEILHVPVERAPTGRGIPIEASFRGPSGVFNPTLSYRRIGTPNFVQLNMAELPATGATGRKDGVITGTGGSGRFVAEIPGAITTGDVEYFLEAMDTQGNGPSHNGDREHPHVVRIVEGDAMGGVDPEIALTACLEVPHDGESTDVNRLGPCRRVPDGVPVQALSKFDLGELKLRVAQYDDAAALFQEAAKAAPEWPAPYFRLGQAEESKAAWDAARTAWEKYLDLTKKPPEITALVKRIAKISYSAEVAERVQKDSAAKAEAAKEAAARAAEERARAEEEERRAVKREMILSSPSSFGEAEFASEALHGGEAREMLNGLTLRAKLKVESAPWLFFGGSLSVMRVTSPDEFRRSDAVLLVAPVIGLNLLALPSARAYHFTLLSPYLAYEPRFLVSGKLHALGTHLFESRAMLGNHFEFGNYAVEVAVSRGVGFGVTANGFEVALGRRFGSEK